MPRLFAVLVSLVSLVASAQGASASRPSAPPPAAHLEPAPSKTELTWWGHAAFVLRTPGGAVLAIDPWLHNPKAPQGAALPAALDAILVTHGHFDHVGDTAELAKATNAKVMGVFELVSQLGVKNSEGANMGGTLRVKDVTIHIVPAVHSSGYSPPGTKEIKYGGNPVGYVIAVDNGPTLYHAGDTDVFGDMALIASRYKPTLALLPIGGHFTMDPEGAALAAKLLKVKAVIPMHFGTFPLLAGTPDEFAAALKRMGSTAKVKEMRPGETSTL